MELELQKEFQIEENRMEKALSLKEHGEFEVVLAWLKYKLWGKATAETAGRSKITQGLFPHQAELMELLMVKERGRSKK